MQFYSMLTIHHLYFAAKRYMILKIIFNLLCLACRKFKGSEENARLAETMGFESGKEHNEIMFLREIPHTVNALNDMGDIVRLYSKNPDAAAERLSSLLSEEDSDSV